jgi:hypothetical protein
MTEIELINFAKKRVQMLGGTVKDDEHFNYCAIKGLTEAADYCNKTSSDDLPDEARFFLIDYAAATYLLEVDFQLRWVKLKRDAETDLLRFRQFRW